MIDTGIHFRYQVIPAGRWERLKGTTPKGGDNDARPHLIPTTERGRTLVSIDMTGFLGHTGLCPGMVILDDGSMEYAYRFINLPEDEVGSMLDQLDEQVHELARAARD